METYYFILASKKFLLSEEPTEEILRERTNYYKRIKKPVDFWLIKNTNSLDNENILKASKKLDSPSAAIISTNNLFITWLKLRLQFVIIGTFTKDTL